MNDMKDRMKLPDAPDSFEDAIREGGRAIRRYEARRRARRRAALAVAAAAAVVAVALFGALRGRRIIDRVGPDPLASGDPRGTGPADTSAPDATPTPIVTPPPTLEPGRMPTPMPTVTLESAPTVTPMTWVSPTPMPTATPEDGPVADGALLYGGGGYRMAEGVSLPETPRLVHARYEKTGPEIDPDEVAGWLWGDDWTKEDYGSIAVYVHEEAKDAPGDFKAKGTVWEDGRFSWAPDDPSRLRVDAFESREAALAFAESWLRKSFPDEYFEHPAHPGGMWFEGEAVNTVYGFQWDRQLEGVAVRGSGLGGQICTFGPSFFALDLNGYAPHPGDDAAHPGDDAAHPGGDTACPAYLSAAQAVDALDWAAAEERTYRARAAEEGRPLEEPMYGEPGDAIERLRPVFTEVFSENDGVYALAWEITVRPAAGGSAREFLVDAETGRIWNMHDGVVDTVYSDALTASDYRQTDQHD